MKRLRVRWIVLAVVLIASLAGVLIWLVPRDPINRANYDRIQLGMTRAEVEEILGPGPGIKVEVNGPVLFGGSMFDEVIAVDGQPFVVRNWVALRHENGRTYDDANPLYQSYRRALHIAYDSDWRMIGKQLTRIRHDDWWDKVIDYLGL